MRWIVRVVAVVMLVGLTVFVILQRRAIAELQAEKERLLAQVIQPGADTIEQENAALRAELERLRKAAEELPRLRGEVTRLRSITNELARLTAEQQRLQRQAAAKGSAEQTPAVAGDSNTYFAKSALTFAGFATPEAAFQTVMWAGVNGDLRTFAAAMEPGKTRERMEADLAQNEAKESANAIRKFADVTGFKVLKRVTVGDDIVAMQIQVDGAKSDKFPAAFRRIDGEWKVTDPGKYQSLFKDEPVN